MKLTLNRIGLFVVQAQRYLPAVLMAYTVIAVFIFRTSPDGDGGPGG